MSSKDEDKSGIKGLIIAVIIFAALIFILVGFQMAADKAQKENEEWLNQDFNYKLCVEIYTGDDGKTYYRPDTSSSECRQHLQNLQ